MRDENAAPEDVDAQTARYIGKLIFEDDPVKEERVANAFKSAIFLATEAWLTSSEWPRERKVYSDPGANTIIPSISRAGIIVVSMYLLCLFAFAFYSARAPRWTYRLDAFALLRIGATMHERLPIDVAYETGAIKFLDKTSGMIGDARTPDSDIGVLDIGASSPLSGTRHNQCYEEVTKG